MKSRLAMKNFRFLSTSIYRKQENNFILKFDSRIFINTKAIEFVVQEYNLQVKDKQP